MTVENDSFQPISDEQLPILKKMLEKKLPESMHVLQYLEIAIKWKKAKPDYQIQFLAPGGDIADAVLLISSSVFGGFIGTAYASNDKGVARLEKALRETKRINWDGFLFTCVEPRSARAVESVATEKVPTVGKHKDTAYYMEPEDALKLEPQCPEGYRLGELGVEHAAKINDVWPHKGPGSEVFVADMIEVNGGLGLFDSQTGELASWGLVAFYGGLGLVQTDPSHFRRGLASAVVRELTRRQAERTGSGVHLNVVQGNQVGNSFFRKLGFRVLFTALWAWKGVLE